MVTLQTLSVMEVTLAAAFVLLGVAMLMHVAKEPKDAHGKNRK